MRLSPFLKSTFLSIKQKRRIDEWDIAIFFRQFATLLTAGIPILQSCEILEKSQVKTALRLLVFSIKRELLSGKDLSSSLRSHDKYFKELACQLIKIGEHTGKLDVTLSMIAEEHEKHLAFKKQIKQALFYPCIISITAIIVTLSMFLFVVPRFADLFAGVRVPLPSLTRWIFYLSAKINEHIILIFLPVGLTLLIFLPHSFSRKLKKTLMNQISSLPFIQPILHKMLLARFARSLAMMFSAGIPITDALTLTMYANTHPEFTHMMIKLRGKIHSGLQLHQAMQSLAYFPDLMIQMVKIGEESGLLDHLLFKIAGFFESDIHHLFNQLNRLLEPLIMIVQGVLIGGLVIGMYLPIFKLGNLL